MTGIAAAQEHADTIRNLARCPQCGIEEGDHFPDTEKKVTCMKVAQAVPGVGVVAWCSRACAEVWLATAAGRS